MLTTCRLLLYIMLLCLCWKSDMGDVSMPYYTAGEESIEQFKSHGVISAFRGYTHF